jgi:hypothetical protein
VGVGGVCLHSLARVELERGHGRELWLMFTLLHDLLSFALGLDTM